MSGIGCFVIQEKLSQFYESQTTMYGVTLGHTNSMKQNSPWIATSSSVRQEISFILWNTKVHYITQTFELRNYCRVLYFIVFAATWATSLFDVYRVFGIFIYTAWSTKVHTHVVSKSSQSDLTYLKIRFDLQVFGHSIMLLITILKVILILYPFINWT